MLFRRLYIRVLIPGLLMCMLPSPGQPDSTDLRVDDLREKLEAERQRKAAIERQVAAERDSLARMREAIEQLRNHYRTVKKIRSDNLAVAVMDKEASEAFSRTVAQLQQTKTVISTGTMAGVSEALAEVEDRINDLQVTVKHKSEEEKKVLETAADEDLIEVRERALTVMNEMKSDLRKQIRAVAKEEKMKVDNVANLMDRVKTIDEGIRAMERAGTSDKVGQVLASISLAPEQMQLLDRNLGLKGKRGQELVKTVAGRETAEIKKSALRLMEVIKGDLKEQIRATTSADRMEVGQLTRLQAKLKRMDEGIAEVEKAGTSDRVGNLLATIQLDLKSIGSIKARRRQPVRDTAPTETERPRLETAVEDIMLDSPPPPSPQSGPFSVYQYISPSVRLDLDCARNILRSSVICFLLLFLSTGGTVWRYLSGRGAGS